MQPALTPPRRVFQPGVAESKPVTPVVKAPKPAPDPVLPKDTAPSRPVHAEVTPAAATPALPDVKITCRECGSTLIVPPAANEASEGEQTKVSCRKCGRINEIKT